MNIIRTRILIFINADIEEIGYTSHSISEVASRTESNFHDVLFAFSDLKVSISELMLFATQADEMPFSKRK